MAAVATASAPASIIESEGEAPPAVGPIDGPVNILLVGSDSGGGNATYGERGENLNDVTILLHISPVSHTAIAVSFPRDLFVPIAGCKSNPGTRKINEALYNGGLACAVSTVEALTGVNIGYAAQIEFDGVIEMSHALGGVEVCVAEAIHDLQINFDLEAGKHTLKGWRALQFLRQRHGVGDGSDTTRISNQQLFLSAMMRKIKSQETLTNPLTVYALAQAAAKNMTLSTSLKLARHDGVDGAGGERHPAEEHRLRDLPERAGNHGRYVSGVLPRAGDAAILMDAIKADAQIVVTGDPGGGVVPGDDVEEPSRYARPVGVADDRTRRRSGRRASCPAPSAGRRRRKQTCTDGQTF